MCQCNRIHHILSPYAWRAASRIQLRFNCGAPRGVLACAWLRCFPFFPSSACDCSLFASAGPPPSFRPPASPPSSQRDLGHWLCCLSLTHQDHSSRSAMVVQGGSSLIRTGSSQAPMAVTICAASNSAATCYSFHRHQDRPTMAAKETGLVVLEPSSDRESASAWLHVARGTALITRRCVSRLSHVCPIHLVRFCRPPPSFPKP